MSVIKVFIILLKKLKIFYFTFLFFFILVNLFLLINLTYYWGGQFKSINILHISGELVRAVCAGCAQNCAKTGYFRGGGQKWPFWGGVFLGPFLKGVTFIKKIYFFLKIIVDFLGGPPWGHFLTQKKGHFLASFRTFGVRFGGVPRGKCCCNFPRYVRMRTIT